MKFTLSKIAEVVGAAAPAVDCAVTGFSVDTRTLAPGDLFFALKGPHHDGHDFVGQALEKGALVIAERWDGNDARVLRVAQAQTALEVLATWARKQWGGKIVGVTGSAGKTTTKDIIATFLEIHSPVGKTVGNLNNHVGVPLSILRLPETCTVAVLEMGMNHAGEIAHLAAIAKPDIGVVTNAGYAHVEYFHGPEGIAAAKRELLDGLPVAGTAVLNIDDERVSRMAGLHAGPVVTYGLRAGAAVRGTGVEYTLDGVALMVDGVRLESKMCGRHGASNLLAGVAVAKLFGIGAAQLQEAARGIEPGAMRGRRFERDGIVHFNDCYNSNPDAALAMVDVLADMPGRRRIAVLGEMLELGAWSERLHRAVGDHAVARGIDVVVGVKGTAAHTVAAVLEKRRAGHFFASAAEAGAWLKTVARAGDVILWKGSRGTRVETALERFLG